MELFLDFHTGVMRQGPGNDKSTLLALEMLGDLPYQLNILDIGCGAGAQTIALADKINGKVVALDCMDCFLDTLRLRAREKRLEHKIIPMLGSMFELSFPDDYFDIIWSEGAIYLAGFEKGIRDWRRFLKPGGFLVASEISWLRKDIPDDLHAFWKEQYTEIDFISAKIGQIEESGYSPIGYFVLSEEAWLEGYYLPLEAKIPEFLEKHGHSAKAVEVVEGFKKEMEVFKAFNKYYGYVFYLAHKV